MSDEFYPSECGSEMNSDYNPPLLHVMHKLPTPYNDLFFQALHRTPQVHLQVHHLWKGSWQRPWQTQLALGYPNRYMKMRLGVDWHFLRLAWRERRSVFLLVDWGHLVALLTIFVRILRRAPVALWVDTPQEHLHRVFWRKWIRRLLLRAILRRVDVVFGTGTPAFRVLVAMGMPEAKFVNLPWLVDIAAIDEKRQALKPAADRFRETLGLSETDTLYSMVGTVFARKGHDVGLEAFISLFRDMPSAQLLIGGDGPDRQTLEQRAAAAGLGPRFRVLGWLEPAEMDLLYAATDVLVHPARFDPYPLAVLEAMAWGIPVVASDASGSAVDRITPGQSGLIFTAGDVDELARCMRQVADPAYRAACAEGALRVAHEWPVERGLNTVVTVCRRLAPDTCEAHA